MTIVTWVLEPEIFPESHPPIRDAITRAGHNIVEWSDAWISDGPPARLSSGPTAFHGSLGNAAHINNNFDWNPGSFCDTDRFRCSYWYDHKRQWLIHDQYTFTTVAELVENTRDIADSIGAADKFFVRPDSPLKPFNALVVDTENLTFKSLDHGFYYDDLKLPIVVAPTRSVGREWRFVIVNGVAITGSGYDPSTRTAAPIELNDSVTKFAASIAAETFAPCNVYVMDVCDCDGELRLVEFNPFGGADLYACKPDAIINAVSNWAIKRHSAE